MAAYLKDSFIRSTKIDYLHFLMKNNKDQTLYQKNALDERIEALAKEFPNYMT